MTPLLPLLLPWLAGAALLLCDGRRAWVSYAAAAVLVAVLGLDLALLAQPEPFEVVTGGWPRGIGIRLRVDRLAAVFGAVCSLVLAAVMAHEARAGARSRLLPALVVLLAAGLHGAFFTGDLFNFYVFFELAVVSSFALAAYGYGRAEVRGTFVYVVVNLVGTVTFLTGVATAYMLAGTLDLEQMAAAARAEPRPFMLPAALLFTALSLKVGLFPFHGWVPVLYSHARPAVAAALSGALVNIGAYGLLRLGFTVLAPNREDAAWLLLALAAAATVYGAALALHRRSLPEVVAYAAVVHAGYVVLAIGAGGAYGAAAAILLVLSGSVDKAALFASLDSPPAARRVSALVASCSATGLPVTLGFVAKIWLVRAILEVRGAWAVVPVFVVSAVLMLAALFRFWQRARDLQHGTSGGAAALVLAGTAAVLGALPMPVTELAHSIGSELAGGSR